MSAVQTPTQQADADRFNGCASCHGHGPDELTQADMDEALARLHDAKLRRADEHALNLQMQQRQTVEGWFQ